MLDFADLPYEFVPPRPSGLVIALARIVNRHIALPGRNHQLEGVELRGSELFAKAQENGGARFLFVANHSTHSDPQVMTEVCQRLGVKPSFMAAYDVFARSKFRAWVMQRFGAFSVDREGSDRKSMKCATDILTAGKYPLVLFPEGNVYLCNDRVTPFAEGASYIALRAQKALGSDVPVFVVPVSLKFTYVEDVRERVRAELDAIAVRFGTKLDPESPFLDEFKRISVAALASYLVGRGHLPAGSDLHADEQIHHAAEQLIVSLEGRMELTTRPDDDLTTRVRKIRAAVHAIRVDPEREADHKEAGKWADEAMLALRILGYYGGYTAEKPTLDRVAETVARLREDVTSEMVPPDGTRRCVAQVCEPIDLREYLESFGAKARGAIGDLTRACESAVQAGIDDINASNEAEGSKPF